VHRRGAIGRGQLDAKEHQKPKRGSGFTNPTPNDWGADDLGQLNARANKRSFPKETRMRGSEEHWLSKYKTPKRGGGTEHYDTGGVLLGDPEGRQA
jgi:hypothetical protein